MSQKKLSIILLKRLCSSRDDVHLGPEKDRTVFQNTSINTCFDTPLFSLDSAYKKEEKLRKIARYKITINM